MKQLQIGLIQIDGKVPNIALMKIASFHASQGDSVEWWHGPLFPYEKIYVSKIFDFSDDHLIPENAIKGGTGYSVTKRLPEEMDILNHSGGWFLYPKYPNHIGFSERGCRLKCSFCVVPEKDGKPTPDLSIQELLSNPHGEDRLVLLDDDFLGHPESLNIFQELIDLKLQVCFLQGLNIRIITDKQASLLSQLKFKGLSFKNKRVTFAWDRYKDLKSVKAGFDRCIRAGIRPYQMQFFVLIGYDSEQWQDRERVETIRKWGADPFVMAFQKDDIYQRRFQRWVNHRAIFNTVSFEEYRG